MTKRHIAFAGLGLAVTALYLNNASWLAPAPSGSPTLYAHRGVHQPYERAGLTYDTCTAERMIRADHDFLENTVSSIEAALRYGADIVEIDIYETRDGQWAVFHDYELGCRTDREGRIRDYNLTELQTLDIGYGYTADGGATYPFRGRFVGAMPSLEEVLKRFPEARLELHAKGARENQAEALWAYLQTLESPNLSRLSVYGIPPFEARWRELSTDIPFQGKHKSKACVQDYLLLGWSGRVPQSCAAGIVVPQDIAWAFWGWPNRLQQRFDARGYDVMAIGPALNKDGSRAIDSLDELERLPNDFGGVIYTNRIEIIGPAVEGEEIQR